MMPSTGWLVGGELKLLIENDSVDDGVTVDTTLVRVTKAEVALPVHCIPVLTFYI